VSIRVLQTPNEMVDPSLLLCGDLACIGRAETVLTTAGRSYLLEDFAAFIDRSAFSIANLEAPIIFPKAEPTLKTGPSIGVSEKVGEKLALLGFDAFGLANNHILDFGINSLLHTQEILNGKGITTSGAGANVTAASQILSFRLGEESVAIICCAEKEFSAATSKEGGAYCPDDIDLMLHVQRTAAQFDNTVLFYHCGNEYYKLPSPQLVSRCRRLAEAGASAIVCHHSHVSSAHEYYQGVPIVYGTGNFIFDRGLDKPAGWYHGYAVSLSRGTKGNKMDAAIIPYEQFNHKSCVSPMHGYKLDDFLLELQLLNQVLSSNESLLSHWQEWCNLNKEEYLGRLFAMNRFSKKLYKILKYPLLRLTRKRGLYLLNIIQCPAHREVLLSILKKKC